MPFDFLPLKQRQFLDPAFNAENSLHVGRFLNQLKSSPPTDFQTANVWFSLFHEGSVAINDVHATLELETQLDTQSQEAQTRLKIFEEKVLSQLLLERETLLNIYLSSPWRSSMHSDDRGQIARELTLRKSFSKPSLAKLQIEENELIREYKRFVHTASTTFNGRRTPLSVLVGHMHDHNSQTRKSAFLAYWESIRDNEKSLQNLFSELMQNRQQQGHIVGESSYIPIAFSELGRHDYNIADCAKFRNAIEIAIVPKLKALSIAQARSLNQDSVRPWDAGAWPAISPEIPPANGDIERLIAGLGRITDSIHPAFSKLFARMVKAKTIHVHSAPNKAPGAFCITLQECGMPFIFGNFAGTTKDAMTFLHEFGHAAHGHATSFIPNTLQRVPSMDFCEVMSTGMEILALPHLAPWWPNPHDARKAQATHLFSMLSFWPFMAIVDEWQHVVYTNKDAQNPAFRNELWRSLSRRFRPHLNWEGLEDFECLGWFARPHIFTSPFYYIDYGIAQMGALQLWQMQKNDPSRAVQSYINGLSLGSQRPLPELFRACNIQFDFSPELLSELASNIDIFIHETIAQ